MASPVPIPNESMKNGDIGFSSSSAMGGSPTTPPNGNPGLRKHGETDAAGMSGSPVNLPDHRFDIADAKMPPQAGGDPGPGAVPVRPYTGKQGMTMPASMMPDRAPKR